jgi:antitoxin ParD1/3/4
MPITLKPELEQVVEDQLKTGRYQSADEVLEAALGRLIQAEEADDFAPGELEELLAAAEADVERGDVSDGKAVFERMRQKSEDFRKSSGRA